MKPSGQEADLSTIDLLLKIQRKKICKNFSWLVRHIEKLVACMKKVVLDDVYKGLDKHLHKWNVSQDVLISQLEQILGIATALLVWFGALSKTIPDYSSVSLIGSMETRKKDGIVADPTDVNPRHPIFPKNAKRAKKNPGHLRKLSSGEPACLSRCNER